MNAMSLNMQQTPKIFVILIFYCVMKQSEGGVTRIFSRNTSVATPKASFTPFIPATLAKSNISSKCVGYFKHALCPSLTVVQKKECKDYVCYENVNSQELFQILCTNGTDPDIESMEQEETHNGNEFDKCNGDSFVAEVQKRVNKNHECWNQAEKLCPKSRISPAKKTSFLQFLEKYLLDRITKNPFQSKILSIHHRMQARWQIAKSELKKNQQRPEPPTNY